DDICAVRVTYLNADTLEEAVAGGFAPGQLALGVQISSTGETSLQAEAQMSGIYAYCTEADGGIRRMARTQQETQALTLTGSGLFETVCAGRDGRIGGVAFFDEDADGVMDAAETRRYAGMTVTLLNQDGDAVDSVRTGADGSYAFGPLSGGAYRVRFESDVVFSGGAVYSAHVISGVEDTRYGVSPLMPIDGDHTDYIVNAGCIYPAQVSGSLCEREADGALDGLSGLLVEMRDVHADALEEPIVVVTGEGGEFEFTGLLAGEYEVSIRLPEGYLCDDAQDGVITRRVTLGQGDMVWLGDQDGYEIVVQQACAVTGAVRVDDDGDGVIDAQARGVSGVRVLLLDTQDGHSEIIRETQTDDAGAYVFDGLYDGTYSVLFELDGEWAFTRYGADSDVYGAVAQSGSTRPITLRPGERAENVDAGVTIPAQLTVSVFKDTQFDGQKGPYEEMLAGVALSLIRLENGEDAEEITYRTDNSGTIVFAGVSPGEYVLAYQMPGQWRATRQVDPKTTQYPVSSVPQTTQSAGRSEPFTLSMGQSGVQMFIGAMLSGSISGTVYYDDDADSTFGESELPCEGIKAELLSAADGTLLEETTTAEDGSYAFEGIAPGRYRVRFTAYEGCGFSGTERTMARGGVEPANTNVSATRAITVSSGTATQTANAGIVRLGALSGFVWEDCDADRQQDAQEQGLSGLTVNLMDGAGRTITATIVTDGQGAFAFDSLRPGEYRLRVDAPDGYVFSGMAEGGTLSLESERQGRGYSQSFTLLGGARVSGLGFGLLTQGEISGVLWEDANYDGVMAEGEAGLRGATVELLNERGQTVATERTIRSGEFRFDSLMPGDYSLRVTLADGYVFTAQGADSRMAQDAQGCLTLDTLPMGGSITDIRIGALKTAQIDGVVWLDQDDDGRRQTGDAGVPGVRVTLTMTTGTDAGKTLETVTNENGAYRFDRVMPGSAQLTFALDDGYAFARNAQGTRRVSVVPMADALSAQSAVMAISAGASITDQDVGVVAVGTIVGRIWEDSAYDGYQSADERGVGGAMIELIDATGAAGTRSAVSGEDGWYQIDFVRTGTYILRVTLPQGMVFTCEGEGVSAGVDAGIAETVAFSLSMGQSLSEVNVGAIFPASISGSVLIDADEDGVCDGTEAGLSGAMVTAMQGGTVVATARTDDQGRYAFDMLRPGTYRLRVSLGSDAMFTRGSALTLPDADAQEGETSEYSIAMGESVSLEPIAVVKAGTIAGRAWMDEDVSGTMEDTEPAMGGVTVELLSGDGETIARQRVGSDGRYAFERLRSGAYGLRFTIGEDVLFTDQTGLEGGSCAPVTDGNVSETAPFALAMGEQRLSMNVGGILPGRIGDTVWLDTNGNGLQDYKEPLIPGVSLTLLRVEADGTTREVATTESDAYGYYRFEALRPGSYALRLNAQPGDTLTFHYGEPLGEIDSDLDPETGMSAPFQLRSGQTLRNVDVGFTAHGE
ncbi:MAG: SdrD B-like domain-containing protein, partial [Candidatus Ventricola sp.]